MSAAALGLVWHTRDRLRLPFLLGVAVLLQVGTESFVRLHAVFKSGEPTMLYAGTGQELLDGRYPHSEYPVGAVLLFAFEAALGGADSHVVHALVMVPFQLAIVGAVWSLRTRWSSWFAAIVAVWPVSAWFWEFRYRPRANRAARGRSGARLARALGARRVCARVRIRPRNGHRDSLSSHSSPTSGPDGPGRAPCVPWAARRSVSRSRSRS